MPKPVVLKSTSVGDLSVFAKGLKNRDCTVSITFDDGFDFTDTSDFKVHMQIEPPEVLEYMRQEQQRWDQSGQQLFNTIDTLIYNYKFFDLILTWNERVLKECPNAVLFPQALCTWIDPCYLPFCKTQESS
jgi:hypothetical protein